MSAGPRHAAPEIEDVRPDAAVEKPLDLGDPGRAASAVVPRPDPRFPLRHDIVADAVRIPGERGELDLRGASVRGLSHAYYGKVRQDAFAYRVSADGRWLVAVVADGVSAGDYSHVAADVVTKFGSAWLVDQLPECRPDQLDWHTILKKLSSVIFDRARARLGREDPTFDEVAGACAATALFAVVGVEPDEDGARPVHVVAIGDTSAWLLRPAAVPVWQSLQAVKNADAVVASSATAALPVVPAVLPQPVTVRLQRDEVLVLMSDGVGDPLGGGTGEVGAFLADAWRTPPDPFTFVSQVGFRRRSFDDDRTVVAVWPVR